jgi:hypothetical protein
MTVSALVTRNDITATASQTSFTYTFRVLEATDMDVYQNGALLASGYTVNDVGVNTGGTVTLAVGVPVGQIVSLVLAMPLDRTTNYQNSGDFLASDVNADFDKIYIGAIQNENWIDRGLRLQEVEPPTAGVDMTIPLKADRLGKHLAFDSVTGAPIAVVSTAGGDLAQTLVLGNITSGTDLAVSAGDDITFTDTSRAIFGNSSDLQIYHDGSSSRIAENGTGNLLIQGTNLTLADTTTGENFLTAISNGAVSLFYNGFARLVSSNAGITVTGGVTLNSGITFSSGAGTPESSITAPVGSLYTRTDGGASTTLYVKESGAGNTGWVAK